MRHITPSAQPARPSARSALADLADPRQRVDELRRQRTIRVSWRYRRGGSRKLASSHSQGPGRERLLRAGPSALIDGYARHRPDRTALYELVRDNVETLYGAIEGGALDGHLPAHVV